jgi:hypothetical protein
VDTFTRNKQFARGQEYLGSSSEIQDGWGAGIFTKSSEEIVAHREGSQKILCNRLSVWIGGSGEVGGQTHFPPPPFQ